MSVYMTAARSAPRSDPANSHGFLPRAKPRRARITAALFERQILPIVKEASEGLPARQHVVDRLSNRDVSREFYGALGAHPSLERGDQWGARFPAAPPAASRPKGH